MAMTIIIMWVIGGDKMKEYAEDSTKGRSMIRPKNYKGDVLVQTWMDSRVLATLSRWLFEKGVYPRFMSEAVRMVLETVVELVTSNGEVKMVEDTGEARAMLERAYRIILNKGDRGRKNILHNTVLTEMREELGNIVGRPKVIRDIDRPIMRREKVVSDKQLARAVEAYRMVCEGMSKEEIQAALGDCVIPEIVARVEEEGETKHNDVTESRPIVKEQMTDEEFDDKMNDIAKHDADENAKMDEFLASLGKGDGSKIKQSNGDE
jgi:hypothetical protein